MPALEVFRFGCFSCQRPAQEVRAAHAELTPDNMAYGTWKTPALVINDKVVSTGRIPRREQIVGRVRESNAS
jgi:hypothetical protein